MHLEFDFTPFPSHGLQLIAKELRPKAKTIIGMKLMTTPMIAWHRYVTGVMPSHLYCVETHAVLQDEEIQSPSYLIHWDMMFGHLELFILFGSMAGFTDQAWVNDRVGRFSSELERTIANLILICNYCKYSVAI